LALGLRKCQELKEVEKATSFEALVQRRKCNPIKVGEEAFSEKKRNGGRKMKLPGKEGGEGDGGGGELHLKERGKVFFLIQGRGTGFIRSRRGG